MTGGIAHYRPPLYHPGSTADARRVGISLCYAEQAHCCPAQAGQAQQAAMACGGERQVASHERRRRRGEGSGWRLSIGACIMTKACWIHSGMPRPWQALCSPGGRGPERGGCGQAGRRLESVHRSMQESSASDRRAQPGGRHLLLRAAQQGRAAILRLAACAWPCGARKPIGQVRGPSCRHRGAERSKQNGSHCAGGGHCGPEALPEDREHWDTPMEAPERCQRPSRSPSPRPARCPLVCSARRAAGPSRSRPWRRWSSPQRRASRCACGARRSGGARRRRRWPSAPPLDKWEQQSAAAAAEAVGSGWQLCCVSEQALRSSLGSCSSHAAALLPHFTCRALVCPGCRALMTRSCCARCAARRWSAPLCG